MRRIPFLCCLLGLLLASASGQYRLVKVAVTGSQRYSDADLIRSTGLALNSKVTAEDLQNAGAKLGSCGAFSSVQFTFKPSGASGIEANFSVKDADRFLPAVFENLAWFTDEEIQSALHEALPLYNGLLPASGSLPDDLAAALTKLLSTRNLPHDVSYIAKGAIGRPVSAYSYKVDNANLKIGGIQFAGTSHMEPGVLAQSVTQLTGRDYSRGDVEVVLKNNTIPLYLERGFLHAAINKVAVKPGSGTVDIDVSLAEGDQYRMAGYTWSGNSLISAEELSKRITLKPGDVANAIRLERDLISARKLFSKFGHEGASITPVPSFASDNTVTYSFQVKEGDLYHMGRVEILGIRPQESQKILQGWKLAEGAPYDNTYPLRFTGALLVAAGKGNGPHWVVHEHIDDSRKVVDVSFQLE